MILKAKDIFVINCVCNIYVKTRKEEKCINFHKDEIYTTKEEAEKELLTVKKLNQVVEIRTLEEHFYCGENGF